MKAKDHCRAAWVKRKLQKVNGSLSRPTPNVELISRMVNFKPNKHIQSRYDVTGSELVQGFRF